MSASNDEVERDRIALKPIETVLVGSSLLEGSDAVVQAAVDVTHAVGGRLVLLHSLPMEALVPGFGTGWVEAEFRSKLADMQRDEVASQVERLDVTVPMKSRVATGSPHRAILEASAKSGADLIVVGASDRDGFAKFLGGTADRVLRGALCPVLVVRGAWSLPFARVLAPVDFSLLSADALECGLGFLLQTDGARPVVELFFAISELQRRLAEPFSPGQVERFALEELERFGRDHADSPRVQCTSRVEVGSAAAEILAEADRFEADLVMLGTHGQGGVEKAFLGSVARAVATEASCPVLVIPPETAIGATVAEAVLEQTAPHWRVPDPTASKGGVS